MSHFPFATALTPSAPSKDMSGKQNPNGDALEEGAAKGEADFSDIMHNWDSAEKSDPETRDKRSLRPDDIQKIETHEQHEADSKTLTGLAASDELKTAASKPDQTVHADRGNPSALDNSSQTEDAKMRAGSLENVEKVTSVQTDLPTEKRVATADDRFVPNSDKLSGLNQTQTNKTPSDSLLSTVASPTQAPLEVPKKSSLPVEIDTAANRQNPAHRTPENMAPASVEIAPRGRLPASQTTIPTLPSSPNTQDVENTLRVKHRLATDAPSLSDRPKTGQIAVPTNVSGSQMQPPPVQTPTISVVQAQMLDAEEKRATEKQMRLNGDLASFSTEMRAASTQPGQQPTPSQATASTSTLAHHVSAQVQEAIRASSGRGVEIALNPKELGRVQMSIAASEGGVTLQILAEKPETLDLMRRHAELLSKDFESLGFTSIDLSFGQGTDSQTQSNASTEHGQLGAIEQAEDPTPIPAPRAIHLDGTGGLDIRI